MSQFVQIHFLTSYPASLLNRDDAGFAKRIPFGGVSRTRISSQCLKRHWRTFEGEQALCAIDGAELSVRSRQTFDKFVVEPLVAEGFDKKVVDAVVGAFASELLGQSKKAEKESEAKADDDKGGAKTSQVVVLGHPEVRFVLSEAREVCKVVTDPKKIKDAVKERLNKEAKKNLGAIRLGAGLDAAMFGRMVTSDILARCDAAIHVAHAFTVHKEESESDYFSAVDDLLKETGELGSGHINSTELTSGLFYGFVVVDVPLLLSNLEGCHRKDWKGADRKLAAEVIRRMVHIIATVSPGAKLGSTAPHAYAHLILVESGNAQPRTLANAFIKPVAEQPDLVANAYSALGAHLADLDSNYGNNHVRAHMALGPADKLTAAGSKKNLDEVAKFAATQILEA